MFEKLSKHLSFLFGEDIESGVYSNSSSKYLDTEEMNSYKLNDYLPYLSFDPKTNIFYNKNSSVVVIEFFSLKF